MKKILSPLTRKQLAVPSVQWVPELTDCTKRDHLTSVPTNGEQHSSTNL